jgi:signal transduction histidine kinase
MRFFEPFYTTKPDGMGIGLSVSRSIVERHRGRIWAMPNRGQGASFAVTVPISPNFPKNAGEISVLPAPGAAARHPSQ